MTCRICAHTPCCDICHRAARAAARYDVGFWQRVRALIWRAA